MYAHMLLLGIDSEHSSHTSGNASDDASDDISTGSDMSFVGDLCIALLALSFRAERLVVMRMNWVTTPAWQLFGSIGFQRWLGLYVVV
jgi:hypothetical protein